MRLVPLHPAVQAALLALALCAGVLDLRYRRIPNWLTAAGVAGGLALNVALRPIWPGVGIALAGLGLAFAVQFLFYALRATGAGDVKLMAAIGALAGWRDWIGIFIVSAILGGIAALALVAWRGRMRQTLANVAFILGEMMHGRPAYLRNPELDVLRPERGGLPRGAILACATVVFLAIISRLR